MLTLQQLTSTTLHTHNTSSLLFFIFTPFFKQNRPLDPSGLFLFWHKKNRHAAAYLFPLLFVSFFAVAAGRNAGLLLEDAVEIALVVEANRAGDLGDRHTGTGQ